MLKPFFQSIIGKEDEFDLHSQIFHRITSLSAVALVVALLLSFFLNMSELSLMLVAILMVLGISYWISRVRKNLKWGLYLFMGSAHALLITNFFLNSGIRGSSTIIGLLVLSIVFAISPKHIKRFWAALQFLLLGGLYWYQYQYGNEHILTYPSRTSEFLDSFFSYFIGIGFLYLLFQVITRKNRLQRKDLILREREIREQRDQMASTNENLYKLMSLIAHDVRNPLASIESYLDPDTQELLTEKEKKEFNEELRNLVRNTSHMLDETLHWSRSQALENSDSIAHFREEAIGRWLNSTIDHLKGMAKSKQIHFLEDYDGSQHLVCDSNLLTVVIRNICQNAIKFSEAQSTIYFKVSEDSQHMIFEVEDGGTGMPPESIAKILNGKAESKLGTAHEKGTGLGLQVSQEYIKLHQGRLEIESSEGQGSTFRILIPKAGLTQEREASIA